MHLLVLFVAFFLRWSTKAVTLRSIRCLMFFKINSCYKNFENFAAKHLFSSLFLIKLSATLLKRESRCFPVKFSKFLRASVFTEHLWWLLLNTLWAAILRNMISFVFSWIANRMWYLPLRFDVFHCKYVLQNSFLECHLLSEKGCSLVFDCLLSHLFALGRLWFSNQ